MIDNQWLFGFTMGLYQNLLFMNTLEDARAWGFVGFKTVAALKKEVDCIPQTKGVYLDRKSVV